MTLTRHINAQPADVYQRLIDLPARMTWIAGIKELEFRDQGLNQLGKQHRCIVSGDDPEIVTSDVKISPSAMEFWETDVRRVGALRYRVEPAPVDTTLLTLEAYVRNNILIRLIFKLLMRKKLEPWFGSSLDNFADTFDGPRIAI